MALPMVAAAVTLFYLSAIPIHVAVRLRIGANRFFGIGVSAFEPRFALRHSQSPLNPGGKTPGFLKNLSWPDALRAARYAASHLRIDRIHLEGTFGSDDAALTALVCGGAMSIGNALRCATGREIFFRLRPDFSGGSLRVELAGMISVRVGHIMLAALLGAYQYGSRRLKEWTSIPLKVS